MMKNNSDETTPQSPSKLHPKAASSGGAPRSASMRRVLLETPGWSGRSDTPESISIGSKLKKGLPVTERETPFRAPNYAPQPSKRRGRSMKYSGAGAPDQVERFFLLFSFFRRVCGSGSVCCKWQTLFVRTKWRTGRWLPAPCLFVVRGRLNWCFRWLEGFARLLNDHCQFHEVCTVLENDLRMRNVSVTKRIELVQFHSWHCILLLVRSNLAYYNSFGHNFQLLRWTLLISYINMIFY